MLLNEFREEEYDEDRTLTELAEGSLNRQAVAKPILRLV